MTETNLILVIDDDEKLNELLKDYLIRFSFEVISAFTPDEGFNLLKNQNPDLVILDVMLPQMDGFQMLKEIRKTTELPVIMLTARGDFTDRIVGLEIGADDYLPKPFEPRELVARIQSVLRRTGKIDKEQNNKALKFNNLEIDLRSHEVKINNQKIDLTSTEFDLLILFAENAGKALTRDEIMDQVRGIEWESFNRSVDVLVSRLRQKLHDDPKNPKFIKTIWGSGYLFFN